MVYRGKPSAGCENCRKAKKRCGLEQPACQRCVKLKKICSGYRDITQLQIQDESESVKLKARRQRPRPAPGTSAVKIENGLPTPVATAAAMSSPSDTSSTMSDSGMDTFLTEWQIPVNGPEYESADQELSTALVPVGKSVPPTLKQDPNDLATTYFFSQFTSQTGHWKFLRDHASSLYLSPVLDLAVRACGMAALNNVQPVLRGREHQRFLYAEALSHLNAALRDTVRCKTDDSLMAVAMLGYYENLTCDSRDSVHSWKAHINGATQLLKIRGTQQLTSPIGRMLFRETRAQILTNCIWDERDPPVFFGEWEAELAKLSPELTSFHPSDKLVTISHRFAKLRAAALKRTMPDVELSEEASQIEMEMIQWSIDTQNGNPLWSYRELSVPDSPHVWNGMVHSYNTQPAATVWNTYRSVRVMLTRTQELLSRRVGMTPEEERNQMAYFRSVRRQIADDICGGIPTQLGHAAPAANSNCLVITGYNTIWPTFFAATCALERIGYDVWRDMMKRGQSGSAASAQAAWLLSRLEFISKDIGLKWADGVAATLKGDFYLYENPMPQDHNLPIWLEKVGRSGKGPRVLLEPEADDIPGCMDQPPEKKQPMWIGRATGDNPRPVHDSMLMSAAYKDKNASHWK